MSDLHKQTAEKIEKALFIHRRQFSDDIADIAAILAECYGPVIEAVHEFLDESGCLDYPIPSEALGSIAGLARLVNRAIDTADGTVTISARKEE